ncbi:MAG: hypothetical protein ACD_21C00284G0009 [uncultured bacterium]|nr:MAG: hypothetical protein ACD_21C00284G0009 [uncultured bacterium]
MKKTISTIILFFVFSNGALAAKEPTVDTIAKDISSKTNHNLKPKVIRLAIEAFYRAKQTGVNIKRPILTVIDYTLASTQKRLWVVDLERRQILHTSLVAHGKYSGENYTTSVSNRIGSLQTSVGLFLTEDTYFGRDGYSLHLQGLEEGFNDQAKVRTIVLHGAPYVNEKFAAVAGRIGRSWGCPAVEKPLAKPIINTIKDGTLIFSFYDHPQWLKQSKFLNQA